MLWMEKRFIILKMVKFYINGQLHGEYISHHEK